MKVHLLIKENVLSRTNREHIVDAGIPCA